MYDYYNNQFQKPGVQLKVPLMTKDVAAIEVVSYLDGMCSFDVMISI